MTEIEKIAEIICDNVEYGFAFSDLSEGGFMRNKYINAATAILDYQKGKRDEEECGEVDYRDFVGISDVMRGESGRD